MKPSLKKSAVLAILSAILTAAAAHAQSAELTSVTGMVTDATTVWDSVKVLILAVVGFSILIGIVKKVKRG